MAAHRLFLILIVVAIAFLFSESTLKRRQGGKSLTSRDLKRIEKRGAVAKRDAFAKRDDCTTSTDCIEWCWDDVCKPFLFLYANIL